MFFSFYDFANVFNEVQLIQLKEMRLSYKPLHIESGRPIAFLNASLAMKLGLIEGMRVVVSFNRKRITLPLNITERLLSKQQVSLSAEAEAYLTVKTGELLSVSAASPPLSTQYVLKKLNGKKLSRKEIFTIVEDIVGNALNEAEIAYFVSGVYHYGMDFEETVHLTQAMAHTGKILKWDSKIVADKHSIGGVPGNRTTPLVIAICAADGIVMPKTSSRAITTAAATADVMDAITNVSLSAERLQDVVRKTNACLAWGGSLGLAPADDKLIRVERALGLDPPAQLIASILSKKLAAGSTHVLLDIPYGDGAKVSLEEAQSLKRQFMKMASRLGLHMEVVITDGSQPIGNAVGPVLEILDIYKILRRQSGPRDLEEKAIFLAGKVLEMVGKAKKGEGEARARKILDSGQALGKFEEIISAQGIKKSPLTISPHKKIILASQDGRVRTIDNHSINLLAKILGCPIDRSTGIYLHKHKNEPAKKGEPLLTLYASSALSLKEAIHFYRETRPFAIK